jgi:hypothetical protein
MSKMQEKPPEVPRRPLDAESEKGHTVKTFRERHGFFRGAKVNRNNVAKEKLEWPKQK